MAKRDQEKVWALVPRTGPREVVPFYVLSKALEERGLLKLCASIAVDHHATAFEVLTGIRLTHVVRARDCFAWTLLQPPQNLRYVAIAELLNMNHTSVISATKRHAATLSSLLETDTLEPVTGKRLRQP